jgi:hypothetical protein
MIFCLIRQQQAVHVTRTHDCLRCINVIWIYHFSAAAAKALLKKCSVPLSKIGRSIFNTLNQHEIVCKTTKNATAISNVYKYETMKHRFFLQVKRFHDVKDDDWPSSNFKD